MRILLVIFLIGLCSKGIGQVSYFSNASTSPGVLEAYEDVIVRDSSYVLTGAFATDTSVFLVRTLDLLGNVTSSRTIAPTHLGFYWAPPQFAVTTEEMSEYFIFSGADIGEGQQGFVMKMDANFDTLWTKYYDLDPDGNSFFNAGLIDDGHLILVGEFANFTSGDYSNRLRIVKMDLEGNVIWNKVVDEPVQWQLALPRELTKLSDGYIVGGTMFRFVDGIEFVFTTIVRKTDFEGELIWEFEEPLDAGNFAESESFIVPHSSDRLFISSSIAHTETFPGSEVYYVDLVLRELNFDTGIMINEWQSSPAIDLAYHGVVGMTESQDHQLVALLGAITQDTKPYLMKVDTLGNVLWEHEYSYEPDENWYRQTLWDIKNTPDGGYIMAGELVHADAPNERWSWVLKVDGCGDVEWQDCELVGVSEQQVPELTIFPNPASDYLMIDASSKLSGHLIRFHDLAGRLVLEQQLSGQAPVDLRGLENGMYLISIVSTHDVIHTQLLEIYR